MDNGIGHAQVPCSAILGVGVASLDYAMASRSKRFIVVTGTPGVGKTAFSGRLAQTISGLHVDLTRFARKKRRLKGYDRWRRTWSVDLAGISKDLRRVDHRLVILDGSYSHLLVAPSQVRHVFVLRLNPARLKRRLAVRGYSRQKVSENLLAEALDVCYAEARERFRKNVSEIDVSRITMGRAVRMALKVLRGGSPIPQKVDWLKGFEDDRAMIELLTGGAHWRRRSS